MSFVAMNAAANPTSRTPRKYAWGVSRGSCPMVWVKTQATSTDTASWNQRKPQLYAKEAAFG